MTMDLVENIKDQIVCVREHEVVASTPGSSAELDPNELSSSNGKSRQEVKNFTQPTIGTAAVPLPDLPMRSHSPAPATVEQASPKEAAPISHAKDEASFTLLEQVDQPSQGRHASTASIIAQPIGIFWRPPTAMLLSLLTGIGSSMALHGYYSTLHGRLVGSATDQQRALQIGTALALITQVNLVFSIRIAYVQWFWRELKRKVVSFKCIDAAFEVTSDPTSFFSKHVWRLKVTLTLALVLWLTAIPTFIAPATLNVKMVMFIFPRQMHVPALDVSQAGAYEQFAYAVNSTLPSQQKFLGPRTIITRLAVATATTGEILALPQPAANASYEQSFFGPYVHCGDSSADVRKGTDIMIERFKQQLDPSVSLVSLDYFAAVPALANAESTSVVEAADLNDLHDPQASNQLWLSLSHYNASRNFTEPVEHQYVMCQLWNASYTVHFVWKNGRQEVTIVDRTLLHPVIYPADPDTSASSEEAMAYASVMWAMSNLLTGSIAFYRDLNATSEALQQASASRAYSEIRTNLAQTILLGSSDLNTHFIQNHMLGDDNDARPFSDQRLQDMAYAGNRSLIDLIAQLSSNITLSLISDPLLAPRVLLTVDETSPINIYAYHFQSVIIAYSLTSAAALITNILGLYAFYQAGASYDLSFSSIACSTHGIHFSERLRAHERLAALPLEPRIAKTPLVFYQGERGRWGFGAADEAV